MHNDTGSTSSHSSVSHNCSASDDLFIASKSSYSSWSMENHHIIDKDAASPLQLKQAHSYLDSNDDTRHHPEKNKDGIYVTAAAPVNKKSKKGKHTTTWETVPAEHFLCTIFNFSRNGIGPGPEQNSAA